MKETVFQKFRRAFYQSPFLMTLAIAGGGVLLLMNLFLLLVSRYEKVDLSSLFFLFLFGVVAVMPVFLTVENLVFLFLKPTPERMRAALPAELLTVFFGTGLSALYFEFSNIVFADWNIQLYNSELHSPIEPDSLLTIGALAVVAAAGYAVLRFLPLKKQPPLLSVLSIAAVYLGIALCTLWCFQLLKNFEIFLCLFPFNCIVIAIKTIRFAVSQKAEMLREQGKSPKLGRLAALLENAAAWPYLALLAALPLLGLVVAVLTLFGQSPDAVIRAWTQTADWTMSQQTAPQNIQYDEHYLCTVAAGGHRRIVKPLRTGKRHGHRVLVNRQLCIANAFEQLLEERTPRFHRAVRGFYDRVGYPVARRIRSPWSADCIYLLMKPLEWLFLLTLYLFDAAPENRIAVQYPHAPVPVRRACGIPLFHKNQYEKEKSSQ